MEDLTAKKEIFDLFKKNCKKAGNLSNKDSEKSVAPTDDVTMTLDELKNFWRMEQQQEMQPKDFEHVIKGFEKNNLYSVTRILAQLD
jgi:hypothetical protein